MACSRAPGGRCARKRVQANELLQVKLKAVTHARMKETTTTTTTPRLRLVVWTPPRSGKIQPSGKDANLLQEEKKDPALAPSGAWDGAGRTLASGEERTAAPSPKAGIPDSCPAGYAWPLAPTCPRAPPTARPPGIPRPAGRACPPRPPEGRAASREPRGPTELGAVRCEEWLRAWLRYLRAHASFTLIATTFKSSILGFNSLSGLRGVV